ncbi:MAG: FkbM family methyltransferase [Rhodobacteraceae bacterium]|jgi:glycosyltransferase involved in cell wall biosynthesis|nr:FkbM family methyltransferase [Paracoccaceae bacterium]
MPDEDVTAAAEPAAMPPSVEVAAFGQRLRVTVPSEGFMLADSLWRLREIHEPALAAAAPLGARGVAVDIGAGFGAFALTFARAFPGWTVWCFEPEPAAFAALVHNIAALGLTNLVAFELAVGAGEAATDVAAVAAALTGRDGAALARLCPLRPFRRPEALEGYLEAGTADAPGQTGRSYPTLPAAALAAIAPTLVKLVAPRAETDVLQALAEVPVEVITGETWSPVPARLAYRAAGWRQTWLPVAGVPALALRRAPDPAGRREGLDVVVPCFNARPWVGDCVAAILEGAEEELRVIVVDDGATDGSGEAVAERFSGDRRVTVHRKENAGCASARNRGRMLSDATHIAFVDADDLPGRGMFAELLDLARYTGAEVVQGTFETLWEEPGGGLRREPSYEATDWAFANLAWTAFGRGEMAPAPSEILLAGQPTIWRRVYRRDFLDSRNIWFPEHIRAFDDQIFQHLTLHHARSVPMARHLAYGYRQHPGQDIRQGDERAFYALEMFRLLARRALSEGWNGMSPLMRSFVNTVNWNWANLRADLQPDFAAAAAELWAVLEGALGQAAFAGVQAGEITAEGFAPALRRARTRLSGLAAGEALAFLDSCALHTPLVRAGIGRRHAG